VCADDDVSQKRISILTTYKGQKHLIRDVLKVRCPDVPVSDIERPSYKSLCAISLCGAQAKIVSTVDRFQGQQNDYVLLSLVRTKTVGYLRDIRRCVCCVSAL
jgi:intron-binding protein aquarius